MSSAVAPGHLASFEDRFRATVAWAGGRESVVGRSIEGRALRRFDLGCDDADAPTVLLTALVHGIEVIGAVTLEAVVRALARASHLELLDRARFVVLPIVNPDAFAGNIARLRHGRLAWRRCNLRGVDLNRNFPVVGDTRPSHPFAGSRFSLSPHYAGEVEASEPETRAVMRVAAEVKPDVSIGFHSFGELLLHPWAYTDAPPPAARRAEYRRLGAAFASATRARPYAVKQASAFYPTIGDLDDWLDATFGTLAFTVEVGALDRRLVDPRRLVNPFWWMNPTRVEETVENVVPAVLGLLDAGVAEKRVASFDQAAE